MRLLPRTPRGTWALAAAVWLAGCAAIWAVLPGVPRVVIPYADAGMPNGFTADGRGVYGYVYGSFDPSRDYLRIGAGGPAPDGPFRIWDLETGRPLVTWHQPDSVLVH